MLGTLPAVIHRWDIHATVQMFGSWLDHHSAVVPPKAMHHFKVYSEEDLGLALHGGIMMFLMEHAGVCVHHGSPSVARLRWASMPRSSLCKACDTAVFGDMLVPSGEQHAAMQVSIQACWPGALAPW